MNDCIGGVVVIFLIGALVCGFLNWALDLYRNDCFILKSPCRSIYRPAIRTHVFLLYVEVYWLCNSSPRNISPLILFLSLLHQNRYSLFI